MEYITKRRKAADEAAETTSSARRTLLGSAAGTVTDAPLRSVDPVFQIASCFTERFDALGKQNAAKMSEVTEKRTDNCERMLEYHQTAGCGRTQETARFPGICALRVGTP